MSNLTALKTQDRHFFILSRMLLAKDLEQVLSSAEGYALRAMDEAEFHRIVKTAQKNHVIVRALDTFAQLMLHADDRERAEWTEAPLEAERSRIVHALGHIREICDAFQVQGLSVMVIKSLDHWPDFGSDIDLYTDAHAEQVCSLMTERFQAQIADRSLGDRMAGKWNFLVPGLAEPVEIHVQRMGQTGEQHNLASKILGRARVIDIDGQSYKVAHIADRIMISTLQRMYRHFYFRLCDIIDSASLAEQKAIDYSQLRSFANAAGIWEGVASYLMIVSDYVEHFGETRLDIPDFVKTDARFGGEEVFVRGDFLRVPFMPQSAELYRSQLAGLIRRGEVRNSARLGLLPWLATAAALSYKLSGSDKGIW